MMKWCILAAFLFTGAGVIFAAGELLSNSGFEMRSFAGWDTMGKGWSIDDKLAAEGTASALCTVQKGDKPELRACLQKIKGIAAGKIVEVNLDLSGANVVQTANSKACLAILCVDANGDVLKEYRSSVVMPQSAFEKVTIDDAVVLPGTEQVYVMLVVEVYQTATDNDWWRFDNVRIRIH